MIFVEAGVERLYESSAAGRIARGEREAPREERVR